MNYERAPRPLEAKPAMLEANLNFLLVALIGGVAGLALTVVGKARQLLYANALVGVAGAWLGSQAADASGLAAPGSLTHFAAALAGALAIVSFWQKLQRQRERGRFTHRYPSA